MGKKPIGSFLVLLLLVAGRDASAGSEFSTLHEVVRYFQVTFVDRPNLGALLNGGLKGIKKAAPGCTIEMAPHPDLYIVKAGGESLTIPATAVSGFAQLEQALVKAARLVEEKKLAKNHRILEHGIIRGIVQDCGDPWTVYLEADLYNLLLDDGTREMGDLGMLVEPWKGGLRVLDVVDGTPAHSAGIRAGMRVDEVNGRKADELNELEALALMRGEIGKKVKITVEGKKHQLACAPEPKRNISVDPPEDGVARIQLLSFRAGTGKRLAGVMQKLSSMGLKGLILDLRGNPGGLVTEGTEVTGLFINGGKVVSVASRDHMKTEIEKSPRPGPYRDVPLVVLMDHRSASVSEIVALALRDHNRAKLVGTKSLGKGTVQVVMELMDGSALKMSNGRYYSPSGKPLYEGIEPDVEVPWNREGEDVQLKRARMLLKK